MSKKIAERVLGGLWGAVVGDALGVPVEFKSREDRKRDPVTGMRGYGSHYQPPGTWSDDSSLLLCTVDSLVDYEFDLRDMGQRFVRWYRAGYRTPWGEAFGVGDTTRRAVERLEKGANPELSGETNVESNGNGSLMRILPVALRFADSSPDHLLSYAYRASSLTHRHPHSLIACGLYCFVVAELLRGSTPIEAYTSSLGIASKIYARPSYLDEMTPFHRFISGQIHEAGEEEIGSSGYVVDTLEASVWCLLNTGSFKDAVLTAINLGGDADTTGSVTGGLAGVCYGLTAIPEGWIGLIAARDEIKKTFEGFSAKVPDKVRSH
jgi:ADP-ribosyl-[dinitrogen reductase] hydrolase